MASSASIFKKAAHVIGSVVGLMRKSLSELKKNDPLRLAGATAFFATFAITPIIIIIIQLLGVFVKEDTLSSQLILRLKVMLGERVAVQIEETIHNITSLAENWYVTLFGFLFLIFVATTLFSIIENSLIQIWSIRIKTNPGFIFGLKRRLRSLTIILLAGILFIVGLLTEGIQTFLGNYIEVLFPDTAKYLNNTLNESIFIVIAMVWFTCLFMFLSEGRPALKVSVMGGFVTAVLFDIGKIVVGWGLSLSNISTIYGTSGSIVMIMLFVFYSSFIFYFGACFIKVFSDASKKPILPMKEAYRYEIHQI